MRRDRSVILSKTPLNVERARSVSRTPRDKSGVRPDVSSRTGVIFH